MEKQRVNKITGSFNTDGGVTISLYRTRNKLGTVTNEELNIPSMEESGAQNKNVYMTYCKDFVINLLKNDGIEGYYYDDTNTSEQSANGYPSKFNKADFIKYSGIMITDTICKLLGDGYNVMVGAKEPHDVNVTESYKDGMIKYASIPLNVAIATDAFIADVVIPAEIRSGQLCKPKTFMGDNEEYKFNITNLKKFLSKNDEYVATKEVTEEKPQEAPKEAIKTAETQEEVKEVEQAKEAKGEAKEKAPERKKAPRRTKKATEIKEEIQEEQGKIDSVVTSVMGMFEN